MSCSERLDQERLERERVRSEKRRLIKEEKAKLEQLEANTDLWHRSQQIRGYVEATIHTPPIQA